MGWLIFNLLFSLGCSHSAFKNISTLPENEQPECSSLISETAATINETLEPFQDQFTQGKTGIYVIEDGLTSLAMRGWFAGRATKSIDVQYFIFASDNTGVIATEVLLRAAERGVVVRLLVDDTLAHGDSRLLLAADAHPNFHVRIFNPNINIGKTIGEKIYNGITDFRAVNHRMHNKTFTVDQQISITGGRNVGDEYFDLDTEYNFRDRDVLLLGGTVKDIQSSFDLFWESQLSVPITKVMDKTIENPEPFWAKLHNYSCEPSNMNSDFLQRANNIPNTLKALSQSDELHWSKNVQFVSDQPRKNTSPDYDGGGLSTEALIQLVEQAEERILIQSPYLIMTQKGIDLFSHAERRGVEVIILTNSLSSTDGLAAFAGYKRIRSDLLRIGVEVYETKSNARSSQELNTSNLESTEQALIGIHAKSMLIDDHTVVIGTYNLDPRSANLNTECIVIVESILLNKRMAKGFLEELSPENAWKISLEDNPDNQASIGKRIFSEMLKIIPKSIL